VCVIRPSVAMLSDGVRSGVNILSVVARLYVNAVNINRKFNFFDLCKWKWKVSISVMILGTVPFSLQSFYLLRIIQSITWSLSNIPQIIIYIQALPHSYSNLHNTPTHMVDKMTADAMSVDEMTWCLVFY
jgi:hypothetical protein